MSKGIIKKLTPKQYLRLGIGLIILVALVIMVTSIYTYMQKKINEPNNEQDPQAIITNYEVGKLRQEIQELKNKKEVLLKEAAKLEQELAEINARIRKTTKKLPKRSN